MSRIQVVGVRDFEGVGKDSQRPYKMRTCKVIATDNDGLVEVGEIVFFERKDSPLPAVNVGGVYEPVVSFQNDKGKISAQISGFKALSPVAKAA